MPSKGRKRSSIRQIAQEQLGYDCLRPGQEHAI